MKYLLSILGIVSLGLFASCGGGAELSAAELTANAAKKAITTTKATSLRSKTLDFAFNKPFPLSCGKGFFWDGFAFASILHNLNHFAKINSHIRTSR